MQPTNLCHPINRCVMEGTESRVVPSLTLPPSGKDRSVTKRHRPGVWPFGTTPKQLICRPGIDPLGKGPRTLPPAISLARYSSIGSGCSSTNGMLCLAGRRGCEWSMPTRKPCRMPSVTYSAKPLSGWFLKPFRQADKWGTSRELM